MNLNLNFKSEWEETMKKKNGFAETVAFAWWLSRKCFILFIILFIYLVTHKTLYNMNNSC